MNDTFESMYRNEVLHKMGLIDNTAEAHARAIYDVLVTTSDSFELEVECLEEEIRGLNDQLDIANDHDHDKLVFHFWPYTITMTPSDISVTCQNKSHAAVPVTKTYNEWVESIDGGELYNLDNKRALDFVDTYGDCISKIYKNYFSENFS